MEEAVVAKGRSYLLWILFVTMHSDQPMPLPSQGPIADFTEDLLAILLDMELFFSYG